MAVQITSDNFEQYFSEYFENYFLNTYSEHSSALENDEGEARGADVIVDQAGMDATLALPGVRYDKPVVVGGQVNNKAKAEAYVQIPWAVLIQALNILQGDAEVIMLDWNGDGTEEHPGLKTQVNAAIVGAERVTASLSGSTLTVVDRNGTPYSVNTAAASEAAAAEWTNTYKPDIIAKTSAAQAATTGAERVNAQLDGMTVTITNRQGVSTSTNIGFEVYRTYSSVAAMNADAANVPQGKFVIIATTDVTDPDNAKLYAKNSQGGFTFLSDLDQASSAAWADWLDNMKPAIEQATTDANNAAANANNKATLANEKATYANNQGNYAKTEGDRAKSLNDHPAYVGEDDYWYLWDETEQQYVRGEYARGAAATIAVGSVSTLEPDQQATVRNSGTEGAAVLNFGIPRGVQGRKGDKGDKGDDLDYSTMTPEEKSELNDTIVQHIVSDNILGPTYDEDEHGFNFPKAMHVQYDEDEHGFNL